MVNTSTKLQTCIGGITNSDAKFNTNRFLEEYKDYFNRELGQFIFVVRKIVGLPKKEYLINPDYINCVRKSSSKMAEIFTFSHVIECNCPDNKLIDKIIKLKNNKSCDKIEKIDQLTLNLKKIDSEFKNLVKTLNEQIKHLKKQIDRQSTEIEEFLDLLEKNNDATISTTHRQSKIIKFCYIVFKYLSRDSTFLNQESTGQLFLNN